MRPDGLTAWKTWAGPAGLAWIVVGATVFGAALRPEYGASRPISALGEQNAPYAPLWNVMGFGTTAALLFIWSEVIAATSGRGWLYRLVALLATAIALSGVFSCDSGCGMVMATWQSSVHTVTGLTAFALFFIVPLVAWRTLRAHADAQQLARTSLVLGVVLLILFVAGQPLFGVDGIGYWQRLMIALFGSWTALVSLRLSTAPSLVAAGYRAH